MHSDVMKKAWQLAKHRQGMPADQAFCEHQFLPSNPEKTERRCFLCGLKQRVQVIWVDIKQN